MPQYGTLGHTVSFIAGKILYAQFAELHTVSDLECWSTKLQMNPFLKKLMKYNA